MRSRLPLRRRFCAALHALGGTTCCKRATVPSHIFRELVFWHSLIHTRARSASRGFQVIAAAHTVHERNSPLHRRKCRFARQRLTAARENSAAAYWRLRWQYIILLPGQVLLPQCRFAQPVVKSTFFSSSQKLRQLIMGEPAFKGRQTSRHVISP